MGWSKVKIFLDMIKFEHTLFALPFAYMATLLVEMKIPSWHNFFWITLAMVGARTAAMALNRIIDREIDAKNPRTANRAIPRGLLSVKEVMLYTLLSFALLFVSVLQLSSLALKLFPGAVLALTIYSYVKRFSWTCHLFLGFALGLAPVGAWIAIANSFHLAPVLLGVGVLFWVAGFDIIYACADFHFDRREGVYSIPTYFGIDAALKISVIFHILAPVLFGFVGFILRLGWFYYAGVIVAIGLLFYQHRIVKPDDLSRAGVAFFNLNGMLSLVMFVFTFLDIFFPLSIN